MKALESEEVKEALKQSTKEAVADGAFGLPFLAFEKRDNKIEGFFGSDRFELIAHRFGKKSDFHSTFLSKLCQAVFFPPIKYDQLLPALFSSSP